MALEDDVKDALGRVVDPARGVDILSAGQVSGLSVSDGAVSFVLEVDPARAAPRTRTLGSRRRPLVCWRTSRRRRELARPVSVAGPRSWPIGSCSS